MSGKHAPLRGEIYWTRLDPTTGVEISKTRPALVVSNNVINAHSQLIMVAPLTSKVHRVYSFEVKTVVKGVPSKILLNHCRAVDKSRLGEKLAEIDRSALSEVEAALKIVFALS